MIDLEHQKLALNKFSKIKVGALFLKMGSGKTKIAVDLLNANAGKVNRLLWVCPNQVKDSTIRELKKWRPARRFRVVAYESISQSERIFKETISYVDQGKTFLVLDESIFIKNGETKRWKRCKELRRKCDYCVILNGTPVVKDEFDLYWQMRMLDERIIPYNESDFRHLFFNEKIIRAKGHRKKFVKYEFSQKNAEALAKLIAPYTFRVDIDYGITKEDNVHIVKPTTETFNKYQELKRDALQCIGSLTTFMGVLTKMAVVAATDSNRIAKTVEIAKLSGAPIIYSSYHLETHLINDELDCYVVNGRTKQYVRKNRLNLFELMRDKPLNLSFGVGSYGLNLQYCSHVIFNSYTWNYGQIEQAKARVLRIGQEDKVRFDFVEVDLPIQKLIRDCVDRKMTIERFVKESLINNVNELL